LLKFFYSSGVPFNVAGNEYLQKALRALDPAFKPPTVEYVRTEGLKRNYDELQAWKEEVIQASHKGTLMGDGWVNCRRQPLINFLISTSKGTIHLKTIDTSGESKDAPFIAGVFEEQINAVGEDNVSAVVTDNAGEMVAAFALLSAIFQLLLVYGCAAHIINRALLELYNSVDWIKKVVDWSKVISKHVRDHNKVQSLFNDLIAQKAAREGDRRRGRGLCMPQKPRFVSQWDCVARVRENKDILQSMLQHQEYPSEEFRLAAPAHWTTRLIRSGSFWERADDFLMLMKPLVIALRHADGDKAISKIYPLVREAVQQARTILPHRLRARRTIVDILERR
ncbi:unnamed protein product, partial [Heterosigma akashiwo]